MIDRCLRDFKRRKHRAGRLRQTKSGAEVNRNRSTTQYGRVNRSVQLLLAEDIVESVDNIMKRIAEAALTIKNFGSYYGQKWKEGFAKEALSSAGKDGGKALFG